ncbi:IucA/IucC family protein [Pilimelia columellifera]|uniref:IucA/IucC family protein n=1 Tax=Pilimelia columellifera TaxID=706574 RepID=UPI0031E26845
MSGAVEQVRRWAPELAEAFAAQLPVAADVVGRRLLAALLREGLADDLGVGAGGGVGVRHGFGRVQVRRLPAGWSMAGSLAGAVGGAALLTELADAVINQAIASARAGRVAGPCGGADAGAVAAERWAIQGHNLHPCGRTRLGWSVPDVLAHDVEGPGTSVRFVGVRRGLSRGDDVGAALARLYPQTPAAPPGYVTQPVHAWQLGALLRGQREAFEEGLLTVLDGELPAWPGAAVRTVLLPPGADGRARYLKLSLDVQITSTRRTISVASARNGAPVGQTLRKALGDDPDGHRVLLLDEVAGAGAPAVGDGRQVSAILREGLDGQLVAGERAVPGVALAAVGPDGRSGVATVVDEFAAARGLWDGSAAALAFVGEYGRLLLGPALRLASRCGIGVEAHLQNCLPTFVAGAPYRMVWRDFAGLRLFPPRLAAAGLATPLWPGSAIVAESVEQVRAKVGYTALQAHLGEVVVQLVGSHGLDERAAWRVVRQVVDEALAPLRADPVTAAAADADHAAWTAPTVPHKALVRMRLAGGGDRYRPAPNPLRRGTW